MKYNYTSINTKYIDKEIFREEYLYNKNKQEEQRFLPENQQRQLGCNP